LKGHGIYYFVPSLLKHFQTSGINELIVPRPRLSVNGRQDGLTPPAGVERVRDHLLALYREHGKVSDCRIELFDCAHVELPEMRIGRESGWRWVMVSRRGNKRAIQMAKGKFQMFFLLPFAI
jgi:hypothetical protein